MTPLTIAIPSKGRLQEKTNAFFARAGLSIARPGGARNYRGHVKGVENVEIAFLSASEIARELNAGSVHLGITGEDLIREGIEAADRDMHFLAALGFGHANVVVAVPQAWIDVRTMEDLGDVAVDMRASQGRVMRVATKYIHLTRRFFAENGIADYRIVESLGATEGAPAAGSADIIVDITSTGSTLAANNLKVLDDGVMLRSQANLIASLNATWDAETRAALSTILDKVEAEERGRTCREVMTDISLSNEQVQYAVATFGLQAHFSPAAQAGDVLHCPDSKAYDFAAWLRAEGAKAVSVRQLDYLFFAENALMAELDAKLAERV